MKLNPRRLVQSRASLVLALVLLKAALELSYLLFVHPLFNYAGFDLIFDEYKYIEGWVIFVLLALPLPTHLQRPSDYLILYTFSIFITPFISYYGLADREREFLYLVLAKYLIIDVLRRGRALYIPRMRGGRVLVVYLAVVGALVGTAWMLFSNGISNFNLDLDEVYEFRDVANTKIFTTGILGYIVVWATTVFGPFLLVRALQARNWPQAIILVGVHVVWFGLSSHKSVLFYPALVILLWSWLRRTNSAILVPAGLFAVVCVSLAHFLLTDSLSLSTLTARRVFFVPSYLAFIYYEFFTAYEKMYWSNSVLSWAFINPYGESPATVIGAYTGDSSNWANTSFFANGYAHAGATGALIYAIIVGAMMKFIDSLVDKVSELWASVAIIIVPMNALLTSSDLPTALLTHGVLACLLTLYLYDQPHTPDRSLV